MKSKRIYAIDVFRGATIALMLIVNNPGSWSHIYPPLRHAPWNGATITDWVFPFFLFIVGMSIGIVSPKMAALDAGVFMKKILRRTALIFLVGLFLNAAPFLRYDDQGWSMIPFSELRIMGVLQRIALCYFFASLIARFLTIKYAIGGVVFLLLVYWIMCVGWHTGGEGADPYSLAFYFGLPWDLSIFHASHLYQGEGVPFDPEGLSSTITACATTLMGYIGFCLFIQYKSSRLRLLYIGLGSLAICLFSYYLWGRIMPINKKIWTSSYAVYTGSLAMFFFIAIYFLYDVWDTKKFFVFKAPAYFCNVLGMNAIFVFALNGFMVRMMDLIRISERIVLNKIETTLWHTPWEYLFKRIVSPLFEDLKAVSFICALIMLLVTWIVAYVLYRRKIYIKI